MIYFLCLSAFGYNIHFLRASVFVCAFRRCRLITSFGSRFYFLCHIFFFFFSCRYLFDQSFQVKLGLNNTLMSTFRFSYQFTRKNQSGKYFITLSIQCRRRPENRQCCFYVLWAHVCMYVPHLTHFLSTVGSSTSICLPFIYTCWYIVQFRCRKIDPSQLGRMIKCERERTHYTDTHSLYSTDKLNRKALHIYVVSTTMLWPLYDFLTSENLH